MPLLDSQVTVEERIAMADRLVGAPLETAEQAVATLLASEDAWLRSCAVYAVGALQLQGLADELGPSRAIRRSGAARRRPEGGAPSRRRGRERAAAGAAAGGDGHGGGVGVLLFSVLNSLVPIRSSAILSSRFSVLSSRREPSAREPRTGNREPRTGNLKAVRRRRLGAGPLVLGRADQPLDPHRQRRRHRLGPSVRYRSRSA